MLKSLKYPFVVFAFLLTLCGKLLAGEQNTFSFTHKLRYVNKSTTENSSGDIGFARSEFALSNSFKVLNDVPLELGIGIHRFRLDDDSGLDLPDTLQENSVNFGLRFPALFTQGKDLFMAIDLMPLWSNAGEHDFDSKSFRFNFSTSLIFRESEKFIFACGALFRPEYANSVIPFFGVRYEPNDRLMINFLSTEPSVSYKISNKTKILLESAFLSHEFEVTSGARKGEIVRIRDLEAGVGLEHDFSESFKGVLSVGIAFERRYEYLNAKQKICPENSFYAGYRFNVCF